MVRGSETDDLENRMLDLIPIRSETLDELVIILSKKHPHIFNKAKDRKRIIDFMSRCALTFDSVKERSMK
jgi:hypothetical protein